MTKLINTATVLIDSCTSGAQGVKRVIVVRYFLDRAGYDLHNSSSRFWIDPPVTVTAADISLFLDRQGIKAVNDNDNNNGDGTTNSNPRMLVEVFLDEFGSFMLLEVCAEHSVRFEFSTATADNPGILNIRLTDLSELHLNKPAAHSGGGGTQRCNSSPIGLFAFSMTLCLDSLNLVRKLVDGSVDDSFFLIWAPYAFFVSGLLQLLVGLNEITRNNIYGATAFMGFGSFWLSIGTKLLLTTYFPEQIPDAFLGDPNTGVATFVREFYTMMFACALFKQTLIMNKLTTALIGLTIAYVFASSLVGWHVAFEWIKMTLGFALSLFAFYLFYAELTNEVYQRAVVHLYPWSESSTKEVFGAAGRTNTLQSKAVDLRTAGHHAQVLVPKAGSTFHVRSVRPESENTDISEVNKGSAHGA